MVVLVNGNTASGGEVFAAALQDHGRATVIGSGTQGVANVRTLHPLKGGDAIALTTARMVRPSGLNIEGRGVLPDLCLQHGRLRATTAPERARADDVRVLCPPDKDPMAREATDPALVEAERWIRARSRAKG
jgi:carboxyl-terminal processing protease